MEVLSDSLQKDWWLSIRLQVLLWINEYLKELNKSNDFTDIYLKHKRQSPFENPSVIKQGFQIVRPEKTIPTLYKKLIEQGLIKD